MRTPTRLALAATIVAASALVPSAAGAVTFSNGAAINIDDNTFANPYPSQITVSGVTGPITDVNVRINSFTHTKPFDVGIVMVGPADRSLLLMDGVTANTGQPASNLNVTWDDESAVRMPQSDFLASMAYKPTTYVNGEVFPAPGPLLAYGNPGPAGGGTATLSSIYDGTSPNGTWKLFVWDFAAPNVGQIAAGWSLDFADTATLPASTPKKKCKKGRKLKKGKCVKKKRKK